MLTKFIPKRMHFSYEGMNARTQLAVLDHNSNTGRQHARTAKGELRFKSQYSRLKGDFVAKKIMEEKSYSYVDDLMSQVVKLATGQISLPAIVKKPRMNLSRRSPPQKADIVSSLKTRMKKADKAG